MKHLVYIFVVALSFGYLSTTAQINTPITSATSASNSIINIVTYPSSYSLPSNLKFNYTRTWVPMRPITNESLLVPVTSVFDINAQMTTEYLDGMGRNMQTIVRAGSDWNDLIQSYDHRAGTTSISLLPHAGGLNSKFRLNVFNEQKNYYNVRFLNEGTTAFSMSEYTSSSNDRTAHQYMPGKAFVGQKGGVENHSELNTINEVLIWEFDAATKQLSFPSFDYPPGQLIKTITKNPSSNSEVIEYTDKEGKIVCKKSKSFGSCGTSACPIELITYYVYDNLGRLVITIPPKAVASILSLPSGVTINDVVNELCPYTIYDVKGRMTEKHVPGQLGNELYIYDNLYRPVLVQTPALRQQGKWLYTVYDNNGRVIMTALHANNASNFQSTHQTLLDADPSTWYPVHYNAQYFTYYLLFGQRPWGSHGQHPVYYQSVPNTEILTEYYYDDYSNTFVSAPIYNTGISSWFINNPGSNIIYPSVSYNTYGKLTGKKIAVLQSNGNPVPASHTTETYFYDRFNNIIQTVSTNAQGGQDIINGQYTFSAQPVRVILEHQNPQADKVNSKVVLDYSYNPNGSLKEVKQNTDFAHNSGTPIWRKLSTHLYDDMGSLKTKHLGEYIESRSYEYNIRGQLTGINKAYAENPGTYVNMTFGESLKYDFGFTNPRTDGNVTGMIWRGNGTSPSRAYAYNYDPTGRLTGAEYSEYTVDIYSPPPYNIKSWNNTTADYSVANLSYDANGNIRSMKQWATVNTGGPSNTVVVDDLNYQYDKNNVSNRLKQVSDINPVTNATYNQNDFIDRNVGSTDYTYDEDGNTTQDLNKGIISTSYNHLGLPFEVLTTNGETIHYTYDAEGNRLREEFWGTSGSATYDYIKQFVYKDNKLQLLNHSEGRCRWLADSNKFKYDYYVKDHLGNVRNVLTTDEFTSVTDYLATNELLAASAENLIFDNIEGTRDVKPAGSPADLAATMLEGNDPARRIGPALAIRVMAGDKIGLKTYGYWEENGDMNSHATVEDMTESIMNALSGSAIQIAGGELDGVEALNNMFSETNYDALYDVIKEDATDPDKPRAYLNYLFFNHDMQLVPEQSGALQLNGPSNEWFEMDLGNDIVVGENGYLVAYLSNEQFMRVYFDNMLVTHYRGRMLEEQHYYPHGLVINNTSIPSLVDRQRLYQGKEWNKDLTLYNFHARQYDPQLGRFTSLDPKGQFYSGYIGMGNNPVASVDPDGKWVNFVIGAVVGGISGYMVGRSVGASGWGMVGYIAAGMAIGAASSGAGSMTSGALGGFGGAVAGSAAAGAISGFGFSVLNGDNALEGTWKGAIAGGVGGGVSAGIGGDIGAFLGGAASGTTYAALNKGNILKSAALSGAMAYAFYHLNVYSNYSRSSLRSNFHLKYGSFARMSADAQRSSIWKVEYGGFITDKGKYLRFSSENRHSYGINMDTKNVGGHTIAADWHTHWDRRFGQTISINKSGDADPTGCCTVTLSKGPSVEDMTSTLHSQNPDYPGLVTDPETDYIYFGRGSYDGDQKFYLLKSTFIHQFNSNK